MKPDRDIRFELTLRDGIIIIIAILVFAGALIYTQHKVTNELERIQNEVDEECKKIIADQKPLNYDTTDIVKELELHWPNNANYSR